MSKAEDKKVALKEEEITKKRHEIKRKFILICVGAVLLLCGYSACFVLQSSINVQAGLGSKTLTTTYCSSMFCCLFLAPFFLRLFGVKKVLISAECCYILYVCANIYPEPTVMIIGGILGGYAEAFYWLIIYIIFVYFGNIYHNYSTKSLSNCILQFCGLGYGIVQFNQILGNLTTFLIFQFLRSSYVENSTQTDTAFNFNVTTSIDGKLASPTTPHTGIAKSLAHCGLNDCQDPNVTSHNIEQYVPQDPIVIYVVIGFFILLMLSGTLVHVFVMEETPLNILNNRNSDVDNNNIIKEDEVHLKVSCDYDCAQTSPESSSSNEKTKKRSLKQILIVSIGAQRDTFSQLIKGSQWLITPITICCGISTGFLYSEVTRAFTSCVLGVSKVGISVVCYSTGFIITCAVIGKFCLKYGRIPMIVVAYSLQLITYLGYLLWKPTIETSWIIYGFFALTGVVCSLWSIILNSLYGSNNYKNKEISLNVLNILTAFGLAAQFGISTLFCVREKIYIVIGALTIGTILLGVREMREKGMKQHCAEKDRRRK